MIQFSENQFKDLVDGSIKQVKKILSNERAPKIAEDVGHSYADKFELAEWVTKGSIAGVLNCLVALGLTADGLSSLVRAVQVDKQTVSLRLKSTHFCKFDKEHIREEESSTHVRETSSSLFGRATEKFRTVTKIKECWYSFSCSWRLIAFLGSDDSANEILIGEREKSHCTLKQSSKTPPPHPEVNEQPPIDLDLTWLLQHIDIRVADSVEVKFVIKREIWECKTPRQNPDVGLALAQLTEIGRFGQSLFQYFGRTLYSIPNMSTLPAVSRALLSTAFVPIFEEDQSPVDESRDQKQDVGEGAPSSTKSATGSKRRKKKKSAIAAAPRSSFSMVLRDQREDRAAPREPEPAARHVTLSYRDLLTFVVDHDRSLHSELASLAKAYPAADSGRVLSIAEAGAAAIGLALVQLSERYATSVHYLEEMLRKQLVSAIGRTVTPDDFNDYMLYHGRRLFLPQYQPKSFCYAIRRPDHTPEGVLSLERYRAGRPGDHEPFATFVRPLDSGSRLPMKFSLDASTTCRLYGKKYLHIAIGHQFQDSARQPWRVTARARQFSGFILMLGRVAGPDSLDITDAVIVANKTEINIPLDPKTIPSAKEFRDAIESLSPAQQRFAKAYRSMQLSHTLFCLVVVQIKPQLERLLNLNGDALTKKIQLTEDLKQLFMKYQIPSDLLSYGGGIADCAVEQKVKEVEGHVAAINNMLDNAKKEELRQAGQEATLAVMDDIRDGDSYSSYGSSDYSGDSDSWSSSCDDDEDDFCDDECEEMEKEEAAPVRRRQREVKPSLKTKSKMKKDSVALAKKKPAPTSSGKGRGTRAEGGKQGQKALQEQTGEGEVDGDDNEYDVEEQQQIEPEFDISQLPKQLDQAFDALSGDRDGGSVRPTILNVGDIWQKRVQRGLMRDPEDQKMVADDRHTAKQEAFDLLDALSRSGSLAIEDTELHVVLAATHCFDKSIMDVIIQDNINPIEKTERSMLVACSVVNNSPPPLLVQPCHQDMVLKNRHKY